MLLAVEMVKLPRRLSDLSQGQLRHITKSAHLPCIRRALSLRCVTTSTQKPFFERLIEFKLPILVRLCDISCFALLVRQRLAVVMS
jgi:hypothetical protein